MKINDIFFLINKFYHSHEYFQFLFQRLYFTKSIQSEKLQPEKNFWNNKIELIKNKLDSFEI